MRLPLGFFEWQIAITFCKFMQRVVTHGIIIEAKLTTTTVDRGSIGCFDSLLRVFDDKSN